jgi:membrane-bound lytic murein transglycosylase D
VNRYGSALVAFAWLTTACAAGPAVKPKALPDVPPPESAVRLDGEEYRRDLEAAYETILSRSRGSIPATIADTDAALSMEIPDHPAVRGGINYFSTRINDKIQASLIRSARYRPMINEVLDSHNLPRALAYLPVIESAFIPTLTSKAGAHGIWQFMPATGRQYGLRVDWWVDERADPVKSTHAAAAFLRDLYSMFGDWPLALAAYNCGPGRVRRTLNETGATSFWELLEQSALPKETRGYVPTFFSTIAIVSDPAAYGFRMTEDRPLEIDRLQLEGPVSLSYVASLAGVDASLLRELNPDLKRGVVPPGSREINLPPRTAARLAPVARTMKYDDPDIDVAHFELRDRDSITSLAKLLRTSKEEILAINGAKSDRFRPGDTIYLPVGKSKLSAMLRTASAPVDSHHVVEKGDTLYSIARRNGMSVAELLDLNQLGKETVIRPGDRIRVAPSGTALGSGGR